MKFRPAHAERMVDVLIARWCVSVKRYGEGQRELLSLIASLDTC